jgi:hypothetical protein
MQTRPDVSADRPKIERYSAQKRCANERGDEGGGMRDEVEQNPEARSQEPEEKKN